MIFKSNKIYFSHLFLMYLINSVQTNKLFINLVRFELYHKNIQIQFKLIYISFIGLGILSKLNQINLVYFFKLN